MSSLISVSSREQPPRNSNRAYWICQFFGWTFFALYVLTFYILSAGAGHFSFAVVILIVLIDMVVCPVVMHGLRLWMKRAGWTLLPYRRLLPRLALVVVSLAAFFDGLVLIIEIPVLHLYRWQPNGIQSAIGMFIGFGMAVAGWLAIYFNVQAVRRRRALETQALELQVIAHDAQLRALRAQLNPHFLFNCLNDLRALIVEDPPRAQAMLTRLAELLRYSLRSDRADTVALEEEMEAVNDYLDLERMRFEDRLRADCFVEPSAASMRVPPMLVQTLVENALKHGIASLPQGGEVSVDARVVNAQLCVSVTNTGSLASHDGNAGLGLRNAGERLRLLYGGRASLNLSAMNGTVVATLQIPIEKSHSDSGPPVAPEMEVVK
jgi:sensor histidine kinase YesM